METIIKGLLDSIKWSPIEDLPDTVSFRCVVKFKEFGFDGNHVSCAYYFHKERKLIIDNKEYVKNTPIGWIPLLDLNLI